ncbi:MAG: carboxypeptidase regulatory-like domain-containing protein, partial [Thermoanaerobaculia bacterium]
MTSFNAARVIALSVLLSLPASVCLAQPIASDDLEIRGMALEIVNPDVQANLDTPSFVQTRFGGRINDEVTDLPAGLVVKGELTGPGLAVPILLQTAPGRAFQLPGLSPEGTYYLQNVRLERDGQFLQSSFPSLAVIRVVNALTTEVTVKQLSAEELRSRGILVDSSNYDVYEYTFTVVINGQSVEIPFPVIVDARTHEMIPVAQETPYGLPPNTGYTPPRWVPPTTVFFELPPDDGQLPPTPPEPKDNEQVRPRPSIPAAIVIPSDFAVLHQFFAVALIVQNGGEGSVRLDSITANIRPPAQLRVAGSNPPVAFGQPITIVDEKTGATFLVAQAQGSAEWTLEALKTGTHTLDIDIRATFQSPNQPDIPLRATPKATIVVHDPSFNVTFSHPDTIRAGEPYSTFAFITNMSSSRQTVQVSSGVQPCPVPIDPLNPPNACLSRGDISTTLKDLDPGETRTIEYLLVPGITGQVVATAAAVDGENFTTGVRLTQGVSASGIPLSPATLVMPYYSRFLPSGLISGNMRLLGLGYSLATAPVNQQTAKFPRVIKSDVFRRAVDLSRAGQRAFITNGTGTEAALANLALDLLGNGDGNDLAEWDQLRRDEEAGRVAATSLARAFENAIPASNRTLQRFIDEFVEATSHRAPYFAALVHGPATGAARPYAVSVFPEDSVGGRHGGLDVPSEAAGGWKRTASWGELSALTLSDSNPTNPSNVEGGEFALIGRPSPNFHVEILAATTGTFTIDLVWPGANASGKYRASVSLTATSDGQRFVLEVAAGDRTIRGDVAGSGVEVPLTPLELVGARQDLHLDETGHKVSILFNRPVRVAVGSDAKPLDPAKAFEGSVDYVAELPSTFSYSGKRPVWGAALQEDGRIVNLTFDHVFSTNASYRIKRVAPAAGSGYPLVDALLGSEVTFGDVTPIVDNDRDAALLSGLVLGGTGEPLARAQVSLRYAKDGGFEVPQVETTDDTGRYFFEYVPRDVANGYPGSYELRGVATINGATKETKLNGAVRIPREVQEVNLSFLGRGNAEGYVRYDDGTVVAGARVVVGSTMFGQVRKAETDATGHYRVTDLPVGPLTFSAQDAEGNVTYAANELKSGGQTVTQNLSIYRTPFPGVGTVRGVVLRSDTGAAVAGAQVGVYSQGYPVQGGTTDSLGRFEFAGVPAGLVTVLAADWSVSREAASEERDLAADSVLDLVLRLSVPPPGARIVRIHGDVVREDAFDPTKTEPVSNALVKIDGTLTVTADANGNYVYESMPSTVSGRSITAWDPVTARTSSVTLDLSGTATDYYVPIRIKAGNYGKGSVRVLLLDAAGRAVTAPYFVLEPGIPPVYFDSLGNGVYERKDVDAGRAVSFVAVPSSPGPVDESTPDLRPFGDQSVTGSALVAFPGHVASATVRLPGQGSVRVGYAPPTEPNQALATGPMTISYPVWNHAEQVFVARYRDANSGTDGTGFATFSKVPALQNVGVEAYHPILGYASTGVRLNFDGDFRTITLQAARLSTIHGIVYAHDGMTPVAGAHVRLWDGRVDRGTVDTNPDGTFEFAAVAAGIGFDAIAEVYVAGIRRNGIATGSTPTTGGPVDGVAVVLQRQGSVDIQVRTIDGTPSRFARVWVRELAFPYRSFGTSQSPLSTDANGQLVLGGISAGDVRVSAYDRDNPDLAGNGSGRIRDENDIASISVTVGSEGTGTIEAVVVDPNTTQWDPVPNAEVALYKGSTIFDLATTDAAGGVTFHDVPAGQSYTIQAYSKMLARSGSVSPFTLLRDETHFERVVLAFSGKVSGTLRDDEPAAGDPREVAGAHVSLYASGYQSRATTGAGDVRGKFEFLGVREGSFRLEARDPLSWRLATGQGSISQVSPNAVVDLTLEPTSTIRVSVWQPNDDGSRSSTPVSAVAIEASQLDGAMLRSTQVNGTLLPGWLRGKSIAISVKEIGGQFRTASDSITLLAGESHRDVDVTLPAFGTVRAFVRQDGTPALGARVTLQGKSFFTSSTGVVVFESVPLGPFSIQAKSSDERLTAYASGTLASQTIPHDVTLDLGSYAAITGVVTAEPGGPSVGTRVVASINGSLVDQLTDANGRYYFGGIPATGSATSLCLSFFGPDGFTPGAPQKCYSIDATYAGRTLQYDVTLDATRPYVVSIAPADGSQDVSRDAVVRVTFSEEIQLNSANYELWQIDVDHDVQVPIAVTHQLVGGVSTVVLTPSRELDSQKLHRIFVSSDVSDRSGLKLPAPRGATFITTDYKGPTIVATVPDYNAPIAPTGVFKIRFNEVVASAEGGFGVSFVDVASGTALGASSTFALEDGGLTLAVTLDAPAFQAGHSYAMTLRGVQDSNGNPLLNATRTFSINDTDAPTLVLQLRTANRVPVAEATSLIERLGYNVAAVSTNADGSVATDIARVEFVRKDISAGVNDTAAPFEYVFVAPQIPESGAATVILEARAYDTSGNPSTLVSAEWPVTRDLAPHNVVVTPTPASTAYPGGKLDIEVTYRDESPSTVTTRLIVTGTRSNDQSWSVALSKADAVTFEPGRALFRVNVPSDLKPATNVVMAATITDVAGQAGSGEAQAVVAVDPNPPEIVSLSVEPQQAAYLRGEKFRIRVRARDLDSGVAEMLLAFDGKSLTLTQAASIDSTTKTWEFLSGEITVPAKNADTDVTIAATAGDFQGNSSPSSTVNVRYKGIYDTNPPQGAWVCPIEDAVLPANKGAVATTLRMWAKDANDLSVTFSVPGVAGPLTATREGSSDYYSVAASLVPPTDLASSYVIVGHVSDGDGGFIVDVPISIRFVDVDVDLKDAVLAITESNVATFEGRSVAVRGSVNATTPARLVLHTPLRLKNLLVLDGAVVDSLPSTASKQEMVDLQIAENLYVDCASRIDGDERGYVGGWASGNSDSRGRTVGNTNEGGASAEASASHGGLGGEAAGSTNGGYGSLSSPADLGSGGGGSTTNPGITGGQGGGAIRVVEAPASTARFMIGGRVSANGASGIARGGAGAGGSVYLRAARIRVGAGAHIGANGGDDDDHYRESRGGGGGRVALDATELLELGTTTTRIEARGGRNGSSGESTQVDGGAGTIFLRKPGQSKGDVIVSSFDSRYPQSMHKTMATPLVGTLDFDVFAVGPRALARADADLTIAGVTNDKTVASVDPTGVLVLVSETPSLTVNTIPAAGSNLRLGANLLGTYDATSQAGIRSTTLTWSLATGQRVDQYFDFPATVTLAPISFSVPANAQLGQVTLRVRVLDRAGRQTELAPMSWTVVSNELPTGTAALASGTPAALYPGKSFTVRVQASDAEGLAEVRPRVVGAAVATPSSVAVSGTSALATFSITIDKSATADSTVTVGATVIDSLGGSTNTNDVTVGVLADTGTPIIAVTGLASTGIYYGGQTVQATITVTDEVGASEVVVDFDGASTVLTGSGPVYVFTKTIDGALPEPRTTAFRVTATDYASHTAQTDPVTIQLRPDAAPTISLGSVVPSTTPLAGATIGATASLTDDVGVVSVTFKLTGAVTFEQTRPVSNKTLANEVFTYTLPASLDGGAQIRLEAIATDTLGHATPATPVDFAIATDTTKPVITSITVSAPPSGSDYTSGQVIQISVSAVDDVHLQGITLSISGGPGGVTQSSATSPLTLTWTVPELSSSTTFTIGVRAEDSVGNLATDSRSISAQPLNNAGIPKVEFTCPTIGAFLPSGYSEFFLTARASDDAGIRLVEFFQADRSSSQGGEPTWIAVGSVSTSGSPLSFTATSAKVTLPTVTVATEAEFRARAWDYSNNFRDTVVTIQVVPTVDLATNGENNWALLEDKFVVLRGGELAIDVPVGAVRRFAGLIVLRNATLTHSAGSVGGLRIETSLGTYVECGGSIDVTGRGYGASQTYPGATAPGYATAGSHMGYGGVDSVPNGTTYGSVYRPAEAGGGANRGGPSPGGGVVRITADRVT